MLRCDDAPPVEQEITGNGSGESLPPFSNEPRAWAPLPLPVAIPAEQWHEDDGPCLWWKFPIDQPPYSGSPLDSDWDGYYTHFTRIVCPELPLPEAQP
jgi:hypothetical protein